MSGAVDPTFDLVETFNIVLWFLPLPFLGLALSDRGRRWWPGWTMVATMFLLVSLEVSSQIAGRWLGDLDRFHPIWRFLGGAILLVVLSEGSSRTGWGTRGSRVQIRRFLGMSLLPAGVLSALLLGRVSPAMSTLPAWVCLAAFETFAIMTAPVRWVRWMRIVAASLLAVSLLREPFWLPFSVLITLLTATQALSHIRQDNRLRLLRAREALQPKAIQDLLAQTTGPRLSRDDESLPVDRLDALLGFAMQSTGSVGGAIFLYIETPVSGVGTLSRRLECVVAKGSLRDCLHSNDASLGAQALVSFLPSTMTSKVLRASEPTIAYALSALKAPKLAAAPLRSQGRPLGLVVLSPPTSRDDFSPSDLHILDFLSQQAVFSLNYEAVYHKLMEDSRLAREFEIAARIQTSLLPREMPKVPGLALSAKVIPAREVGGDYYDLLPLPDDKLAVVIGDVSGKGLPAGMIMLIVRTTIHLLVDADPQGNPAQLLRSLEEKLAPQLDALTFMTFLALRWSARDRILTWSGAGHEHILWRSALDGKIHRIKTGGLALGLQRDHFLPREERKLMLSEGDVILLYTDGVIECRGPDGTAWGLARLEESMERHHSQTPEELLEGILSDLDRFRQNILPSDDRTLLVMKAS
ncbi:MAG: PP2C family protein-serine/threonine phosphatase [Fibrobacterota bacterium]|nr:MAG: PP2C family protein-serine/threonine phosphatase [Fibrobacterota bacterium]